MRYYTYINTSESGLINWSWVHQSIETCRRSIDGEKLLISFEFEYCDEFERFNGLTPLNSADTLTLMDTEDWYIPDELE